MSREICFLGSALWLLTGMSIPPPASAQASEAVVLFRLTHCCPQTAWTEAEYAVLKELDTMDVSVTMLDRTTDSEKTLDGEIEALGKRGSYAALLYFYKSSSDDTRGVRIAVFDDAEPGGVRRIDYAVPTSKDAVSIITLKTVEAVREVIFGPPGVEAISPETDVSSNTVPKNEKVKETEDASAQPKNPEKPEETDTPKEEEPPKPPRSRRPKVKIAPHRFALGLGPEGWWSPGGAGGALALRGAFNARAFRQLFAELNVCGSLVTDTIYLGVTPVEYRTVLFRAALYWQFLEKRRLHPVLGIFGGAALFIAAGKDGENPRRNTTDTETVAVLGGLGRLAAGLSDHFGLILGAEVSLYLPELGFTLGDEVSVRVGRPVLDGHLGLEYRF